MAENQHGSAISLIGAIAGIIAAIVAIVATLFAGYVHLERTYVKNEDSAIEKFRADHNQALEKMRKELGEQFDQVKVEIKAIKKETQTQRDKSEAIVAEIIGLRSRSQELVERIRSETIKIVGATYRSQLGSNDEQDNGPINARQLKFRKTFDETALRVSYTDNFRVKGTNKACRWELKIDGGSCPSGQLIFDRHDGNGSNVHGSGQVMGYCTGVPKGDHSVQAWVYPMPGADGYKDSDCYTGWNNSTWVIEVFETRSSPQS